MHPLLCFLLFLLYCSIGTLAVTEHHRCIFHLMSKYLAPPVTTKGQNTAAEAPSPEPVTTAAKPPPRSHPDKTWAPIRIKFFAQEVDFGSKYCVSANQIITNNFDADITCTAEDVLTEEKKRILVNEILPEAIKLHSERLLVQPLDVPLVVPNFSSENLCSKFTIPQHHRQRGIPDADMVLYIGALPVITSSFAWTAPCAVLAGNGRPVVGVLNYSPRYIVATPQRVRVAAHEIAHVLGFSTDEMVRTRMVQRGVTVRERQGISLVVSPNARRESMEHYNCKTMQGIELEDESPFPMMGGPPGGSKSRQRRPTGPQSGLMAPPPRMRRPRASLLSSKAQEASVPEEGKELEAERDVASTGYARQITATGSFDNNRPLPRFPTVLGALTANAEGAPPGPAVVEKRQSSYTNVPIFSHWKRRNAKDELMVGLVGAGYYTPLTMGFFADLGYYKVNWTMAEQMSWGNKAGCELLDEKCVSNDQTRFPDMFCTSYSGSLPAGLQCTSDRQSLGSCNIIELEYDLPRQYQYFSDALKGGEKGSQMDYCPFIAALPERSCINGNENEMPGSKIGANSRCVKGEKLMVGDAAVGAVCVEVSCRYKVVSVRYSGDSGWHSCAEGEKLTVKGDVLKGLIVCPQYADVCNTINRTLDEAQGRSMGPRAKGSVGNGKHTDGSVAAAVFVPLLFIFFAVSTIIAP